MSERCHRELLGWPGGIFPRKIWNLDRKDPICCSSLTWFGHDFSAGQFLSVRSLLIAATTWYSGFFLLSFATRLACDTAGQSAKMWIWVSSEAITIGRSTDYFITYYTVLTRPYKVETVSCRPRLQFLALNLDSYHVIVSLSFLRSISLASLLHLKSRDFEMLFMSAAFSKRYLVKKDQSRRIVRWQAFLEQYYLIFVNIMHVHIPCALL